MLHFRKLIIFLHIIRGRGCPIYESSYIKICNSEIGLQYVHTRLTTERSLHSHNFHTFHIQIENKHTSTISVRVVDLWPGVSQKNDKFLLTMFSIFV